MNKKWFCSNEGIDDFCIDSQENGKSNLHTHSNSSDTEGEDLISEVLEEQHKNENKFPTSACHNIDESDSKHICYK